MQTASLRRTTRQLNLLEHMDKKSSTVGIKVPAVERDSGVYDPLSVNYSQSTCSGIPSSNSPDTTASSAYSSATSSCCDSRLRPEVSPSLFPRMPTSGRVPHHPKVTALPSESSCSGNLRTTSNLALPPTGASSHYLRSRGGSATSTRSEPSVSEGTRFLYNVNNCKIYEKKRLLGKVNKFKINFAYQNSNC